MFTGFHKEYCPQRACQLFSVGYTNIPMRADWRINQCLFHHVTFVSVTLLGAAFCHYYSGFYDYKSPWVLIMFASGKCCLWANPLDWCASRNHDYISSFSSIHRIFVCYPSVVFLCVWKEEMVLKEGRLLIHLKHPPTHTHTYPHINNNKNPIFSLNLTRNTTDHWWKLIHASWVQGRSGLYFTESGRSHSATPCFRLHWRHVWLNGTAVRKLETYLLPRLVCVHVHIIACIFICV